MIQDKPEGFEKDLSEFGIVMKDSGCGEPIAWGFEIINHLGEERFNLLKNICNVECVYPAWVVVTKYLTVEEAIQKYGEITHIERGPRGGFKYMVFGGNKTFYSRLKGYDYSNSKK